LIRTNYSFTGEDNKGMGYIRYATASDLFTSKYEKEKISFEFLINDVPRCLVHSFTKADLSKSLPESEEDKNHVFFRDYIPRYSTSAAIVVQGVKNDELPSLTTMWTILGFPLSSVAVPVWLLDDGTMPKVLQSDKTGNAPLCDLALKLKDKVFPIQNDASENYLNVAALMNKENTGVRQKLIPIEDQVLSRAKDYLTVLRHSGLDESKVKEFYNWIDVDVYNEIKSKFHVN
jgi:hypothetical protein